MAIPKTMLVVAILCFLFMHEMEVYCGSRLAVEAQKIDCKSKCKYRCSKTWRQKMCMRACNTCCQRCNCVPPGTAGNEDICPCYSTMTTHGGRHKCP